MGWKDKLKTKADAALLLATLSATGMTPGEIKEMFKTRSKEKLVTFGTNFFPFLLKLFVIFLVVFQAFYPKVVSRLLLIFIILAVVLVVASLFLGGFSSFILSKTIPSIVILAIILFFIWLIPSPEYSRWLAVKFGPLTSGIIFLIVLGISMLFLLPGTTGFIIGMIVWCLLLFWIGPFVLKTLPSAGFCIPQSSFKHIGSLPFLEKYKCGPIKKTLVFQGKMVKIPVSGGIQVEFGIKGKPRPLLAGREYQEVFTLNNYYEGDIEISSFIPWIHSKYMKGIDFINKEYKLKKNEFKPKEPYQDVITFNPKEMEEKASVSCPWNSELIKANKKYTGVEEIECASDKPCSKGVCVAIANFVCTCVDWTNATCSGSPLYLAANVTHTGFFRGNASLYYSENPTSKTITFPQLTQGPIRMMLNFIPNPYVRKYYEQYVDTVELFADFQFSGYQLKINSINVEPILTTVTTRDYQHNLEINETIGIKKKSCEGISSLKEAINSGAHRWSGVLCDFTKPDVTLKITNTKTGETISLKDINLDQINEYCKGELSSTRDVYNLVKDAGLCTVLNNTAVRQALGFTQVVVEMDYTITETFYSSTIRPYWTSACG